MILHISAGFVILLWIDLLLLLRSLPFIIFFFFFSLSLYAGHPTVGWLPCFDRAYLRLRHRDGYHDYAFDLYKKPCVEGKVAMSRIGG